jgi:hypothetical protein
MQTDKKWSPKIEGGLAHLAHGHEGIVVDVVGEILVQVHRVGDHEVEDVVGSIRAAAVLRQVLEDINSSI